MALKMDETLEWNKSPNIFVRKSPPKQISDKLGISTDPFYVQFCRLNFKCYLSFLSNLKRFYFSIEKETDEMEMEIKQYFLLRNDLWIKKPHLP